MKLSSIKIDHWPEFIQKHQIDLRCVCVTGCGLCGHTGLIQPRGTIAYDTGYLPEGRFSRLPYPGVVAFEHQGRIWLAACRLLIEPSPFFAMAWIELFPNCEWLPEQFADLSCFADFEAMLPRSDADRLRTKIRQALEFDVQRSQEALRRFRELEQKLPKEM